MKLALEHARITPEQVDYINAHATSTDIGDLCETRAIKEIFGENAYKVPISSTKSMTGHLLGGAGGVEMAACALAIRDSVIPPTINLENPGEECDLDYTPNVAREKKVRVALNNSFEGSADTTRRSSRLRSKNNGMARSPGAPLR